MTGAEVVLTSLVHYEDALRALLTHLRNAPQEAQDGEVERAEHELFIVSREQGAFTDLIIDSLVISKCVK
jgi:hypothetical protein